MPQHFPPIPSTPIKEKPSMDPGKTLTQTREMWEEVVQITQPNIETMEVVIHQATQTIEQMQGKGQINVQQVKLRLIDVAELRP